jgi:hypothetical protein
MLPIALLYDNIVKISLRKEIISIFVRCLGHTIEVRSHHWINIGMFDCRERSFKWRTVRKYFAVFSPLTTVE